MFGGELFGGDEKIHIFILNLSLNLFNMKTLLFIPFLFLCSVLIGQSNKIIGTPIRIGIEVAQNDFPTQMILDDAVKACTDLGNGWRLPTKDELNLMYLNKDKIGCFQFIYWSSTKGEGDDIDAWWLQNFKYGWQFLKVNDFPHSYVRAVRSF